MSVTQHTTTTIYTVSRLTSELKSLLENKFPFIWINGEISNLSRPSSGHIYFTLKDTKAQINAVMFRNQCRSLKFVPENGLSVTGLGRLSLYEPRGTYQIIFEFMEPKGTGALQLAYEQLKNKLSDEGLFDTIHKKPLPFLPKRIGVITSPSGAVIHDIITVIGRRYPNVIIDIVPVKVQGDTADKEIVAALSLLNRHQRSDVIILARGGGSIEDFMPFNSESVARAVFSSTIPVVSAIGHETDYTISDFVADLRAPTPSAAAEIVLPLKRDLKLKVSQTDIALKTAMVSSLTATRARIERLTACLVDPKRRVQDLQLLNEDLFQRLIRTMNTRIAYRRNTLSWKQETLLLCSPKKKLFPVAKQLSHMSERIKTAARYRIDSKRSKLRELTGRLVALNPEAIIRRGYSITRTLPDREIITDSKSVSMDQRIEVLLANGSIECIVKGIIPNGQKKIV